jgi:anti-sigma B factor antagonist/stage II sporulation protein AA (anti-sigma F factor antagonist)
VGCQLSVENYSIEYTKGITVISINYTKATLKEAQELKEVLDKLKKYFNNKVILDLSQCEFIDSTFLGAILLEKQRIINKGGKLKVIKPPNLWRDLLAVTQTVRRLKLFKTRKEAIENFDDSLPIRETF